MNFKNIVIISGGQSGVDRAALDFALEKGIACGGFCPKGRLAEDGIIDHKYPLTETISSIYKERTRLNVEISDALLVIYRSDLGSGTNIALQIAKKAKKPIHIISLNDDTNINSIINWLKTLQVSKLNIAGPRESTEKGIYADTYSFLMKVFTDVLAS